MFNLFINAIEAIMIATLYAHCISLKKKISRLKAISILSGTTFFVISLMNYVIFFEGATSLVYIVVDLLLLRLISNSSLLSILNLSLICNLSTSISVQTAAITSSVLFGITIDTIFINQSYLIISILISKFIFAILCFGVYKVYNRMSDLITKYSMIFTICFTLIFIITLFLENAIFTGNYNYFELVASSYLMLLLSILLFWLTIRIKEDSNEILNKLMLEKELEKTKEQFKFYEASNEAMSILRHDMKNIMIVLRQLIENKEYDEARAYINENFKIIEHSSTLIITGYSIIDCVLNSYASVIKEKRIQFVSQINKLHLHLFSEIDIAVMLGNMLSNAIENVSKIVPYIELKIDANPDFLIITIENTVDTDILAENPDLATTKTNPEYHGFGIKSIANIAKKYDGSVQFFQSNGVFYCVVEIKLKP